MKKNTKFGALRGLVIVGALIASSVGASQAAVTFTISGNDADTTATIDWAGSVTLFDLSPAPVSSFAIISNSNGFSGNVGGTSSELNWTNFNWSNANNSTALNLSGSTLQMVITDTSNGNAALVTHDIDSINLFASDAMQAYSFNNFESYPAAIAAGDVATFSGSATIALTGTFGTDFNKGTYVDDYNGQNATLVISAVPEPSRALLLLLGGISLLMRRAAVFPR